MPVAIERFGLEDGLQRDRGRSRGRPVGVPASRPTSGPGGAPGRHGWPRGGADTAARRQGRSSDQPAIVDLGSPLAATIDAPWVSRTSATRR